MPEKELVIEILKQIYFAINRIMSSCENIKIADDFIGSNDGTLRLESACMLLSTVGESIKNLD